MMHWIAAAHLVGRPLSITEWNVTPFPVADRHTIPLYMAGTASQQGWDALMQFAYSEGALDGPGRPSNWQAFNDPALLATLPAAALLFRRGDVQEARTVYVFTPTKTQLFNQEITPANSVGLRTAAEKGKLLISLPQTPELPWLAPSRIPDGAKVFTDTNESFVDKNADETVSDNGELRRNWKQGTLTINTPRTQATMGQIGGKTISLADIEIKTSTTNATVAVQSLDNKAISEADSILISLGAQSRPKSAKEVPFYSELVVGQISIRAKNGLKLYVSRGNAASTAVEVPYQDGRYIITLDRNAPSYWLVLK